LLRDGAKVFATTRFFNDAFLRYKREDDYEKWAERLYIVECDFTSALQVQMMIEKIKDNTEKVDILINNAAQTIVRPK
jgi:NAD(P)-dependent dehydrogenase (short-subunit alcohol dehydrogenase family)